MESSDMGTNLPAGGGILKKGVDETRKSPEREVSAVLTNLRRVLLTRHERFLARASWNVRNEDSFGKGASGRQGVIPFVPSSVRLEEAACLLPNP